MKSFHYRLIATLIVGLAALFMSGCATVTRGTKDTLVIESDPAGADVRLSTGQTGKTPTSFKLKRKESVVVTISREGFEPLSVTVNSQVVGAGAAGMAGNVLVGGLIGVGVDAWSGATKSLKPNPVSVKLVKSEPKVTVTVADATSETPPAVSALPASDALPPVAGTGSQENPVAPVAVPAQPADDTSSAAVAPKA